MSLEKLYHKFRGVGYTPPQAIAAARTLIAWESAGGYDFTDDMPLPPDDARVRIRPEPDKLPYDAGDTDQAYTNQFGRKISADDARAEIERILDLYGNWVIFSEFLCPVCNTWKTADCIGGCAGYRDPLSPYENAYIVDLMQSALDQLNSAELDRIGARKGVA